MMELSDAALVMRGQAGDKEAFSQLVSRHWGRVWQVLWAIVRHPAEVDDLLQETFLQAYLQLDQLRQPERFRAWVCGIGLNLARMSWRATPHGWLSWERWDTADPHPMPEQLTMQRETAERLAQAIADLPLAEREAILLVYGDELNHQETADLLGVSLSAVKVRVHRGRRRLQAALQNETGQPPTKEVKVHMIEVMVHDVLIGEAKQETDLPTHQEIERMDRLQQEAIQTLLKGAFHVVFLKEKVGNRALCIWIGPAEGMAIALYLKNEACKRPLTADLMKTLLDLSQTQVSQVVISRLHEKVFYATLSVKIGRKPAAEIDCRPSDAINLALRMNAPIFVAPDVMETAAILPGDDGTYTPEPILEEGKELQVEWRSLIRG